MKKKTLLLTSAAIATGIVVCQLLAKKKCHCCHSKSTGCSKKKILTNNEPVYLRETETAGHGLY
ncbi:hypothetical protein [Liquorilactobacillus vini]|uniref:Uncharacterized protein n=1 Tax=Liquorilactobacillus vini DSM 20605 TaxID=1133569 RepID=A0A0R2BWH1_9LACO|nr:hypothetical protein [Liquorilactobacillus vini]KRM83527.1 hypothetical protein FD21_GL000245 [Liquorilactobacillus vini DSM 20605]